MLMQDNRPDGLRVAGRFPKAGALSATVLLGCLSAPSYAVAQIEAKDFPEARSQDDLNVDITSGMPFWSIEDVAIGSLGFGLKHSISSYQSSMLSRQSSWWGGINTGYGRCRLLGQGVAREIVLSGVSECFYFKDGVYTSFENKGSVLEDLAGGGYLYTVSDGTRYTLTPNAGVIFNPALTRIDYPSGNSIELHFEAGGPGYLPRRLRTVASSSGYRLFYRYQSDTNSASNWGILESVVGYNAAHAACPTSSFCNLGNDWPSSFYSDSDTAVGTVSTIRTASGEETAFTFDQRVYPYFGRFNRVRLPGSSVDNIIYNYCPNQPGCSVYVPRPGYPPDIVTVNDMVVSASLNGQTWTYGLITSIPYVLLRNSTSPFGLKSEGRTTDQGTWQHILTPEGNYYYSGSPGGRLSTFVTPAGVRISPTYGTRGNIWSKTTRSADESQTLVETATYPTTCENRITCNRQTSHTDARGLTTTFEYDPVHGGLVRKTGPSVDGVAPQTRYTYFQKSAYFYDAAGNLTAGAPVWLLQSERYCRTSAAAGDGCAVPGDEHVKIYEYAPPGVPDNLLVLGIVEDATGTPRRTCYTYDRLGNRTSETSPNAQLQSCAS